MVCMVCKTRYDYGGTVYKVDNDRVYLCKSCGNKLWTNILVCCDTCGFNLVCSDELSGESNGLPIIRMTNCCIHHSGENDIGKI